MEEAVKRILKKAMDEKVFPGAVVGVVSNTTTTCIAEGRFTYEKNSTEVRPTSQYDVASITKAIPTSSLALQLIDRGKLKDSDTVSSILPQFLHEDVTIWHLLTQTLSLKMRGSHFQLSVLKDKSPDEILEAIYAAELAESPGSTYAYNNATSIILGKVIEKVSGKSLKTLADEEFFQPLGMTSTTFYPKEKENTAPTEIDLWRGLVQGVVHDESAYTLSKKMAVGSAGLFSTVPDLLQFLSMILAKGFYKGKRYFSEEIIDKMCSNQLEKINSSTGLGWELNQPQYMGNYTNEHMIGKTGFTGCVVMIDVPKQKGMVLLCNHQLPHRKPDGKLINEVRRDLADIVFAG